MKVLPKSNREHKQEMKAALTKGHIDFVLSVAADRKLSFSAALNWIIDQEINRELYQLLTRSA